MRSSRKRATMISSSTIKTRAPMPFAFPLTSQLHVPFAHKALRKEIQRHFAGNFAFQSLFNQAQAETAPLRFRTGRTTLFLPAQLQQTVFSFEGPAHIYRPVRA